MNVIDHFWDYGVMFQCRLLVEKSINNTCNCFIGSFELTKSCSSLGMIRFLVRASSVMSWGGLFIPRMN